MLVAVAVLGSCLLCAACAASIPSRFTQVLARPVNKILSKKYKWELDTDAMVAKSTFKIKPKALLERCRAVVDKGIGLDDPDDLAEDFAFQFPVIGPLSKAEYLEAVGEFKLALAFPDLNPGFHDFRVDPFETNRVWFTSYFDATHTGTSPVLGKPTGKRVICPPQALSLTFNEAGKVTYYTGGYVLDKTIGNSGGMGGIFGPLYTIGRAFPFPEGQPYSPSLHFRAFSFFGQTASKLQKAFGKK